MKLFDTRRVGLGAYTTTDLDVRDVVGEYTGTLCEYAALLPGQPNQSMKENSGYTMLYNAMSSRKKFVYVEGLKCGSITRVLSHACEPNAAFVELQNRTSVKVLVKLIEDVKAGAEITVHYGDGTWFKCACDNYWEENEADTVE
ncbi:hypothetical protein PF008_g23959 [Phytophthora fragariae]|uniref:SET domain-containing protein n=2 Tax=Phytophthora fragariae TaxID=53985 RepID=A0A6G0QQ50_9STRA|nr:hypothetical protein PF008_g23959 [Phytophthora fragariae]